MPNDSHYRLELIDETSPNFFSQLEYRAMMLADEIEEKAPQAKKWGTNDWDFHQQVLGMSSWGILQHIDGWQRKDKENPASTFPRNEARQKSLRLIGWDGVQEAYEVAVNGALHAWMKTGRPGFQRGHSILLQAVALNPESLFYDTITPAFEKRLVNGAIWEEFQNIGPYSSKGGAEEVIEKILADKAHLLDPAQARKGIDMLERNLKAVYAFPNMIYEKTPDLRGLSRRAIRAYGQFITNINESGSVEKVRLTPFARGYIDVVRGRDQDGNPFFFEDEREQLESSPLFKKYASKLAA